MVMMLVPIMGPLAAIMLGVGGLAALFLMPGIPGALLGAGLMAFAF